MNESNLFLSCIAVCGQVCMRFSTPPRGRLPAATLQAEIPQAMSTVGIREITVRISTDKIFSQFLFLMVLKGRLTNFYVSLLVMRCISL